MLSHVRFPLAGHRPGSSNGGNRWTDRWSDRLQGEIAAPPFLPDPIPTPDEQAPIGRAMEAVPRHVALNRFPMFRGLRTGCYLIRYTPIFTGAAGMMIHYDGTLRVERQGFNTTASGDLYVHRPQQIFSSALPGPVAPAEPSPSGGIPIFPRSRYRYYVRVTQILETFTMANSFTLGFELHRFDAASGGWTKQGDFTSLMSWTTPPSGYPSASDFLTGEVKNSADTIVGNLTMGWISGFLRRAVVEIDRVSASEAPLSSGTGVDWKAVFEAVGWDVAVVQSDSSLGEPSGESWSDAELHAEMLARRSPTSLDRQWRYHVLCVRRLDSTSRGIMYDAYAGDSNNIPREGLALSSHWMIPNADPWGLVKGQRFGTAAAPYFRTVIHELGHALGLYHNTADNGFMNTTDVIAGNGTTSSPFPNNIQWSFSPEDQKRLRHMPDVWVRPGGTPFGADYSTAPISIDDLVEEIDGLEVRVKPVLSSFPLGAPVRVDFELLNGAKAAIPAPASLSLKRGHVRGKVLDPAGNVRTFSPIVICVDDQELRPIEPGEGRSHSLTLLRGPEGALFSAPGPYRIVVEVDWEIGGTPVVARGEASVMVTPAVDDEHAAAALRILTTPDVLLALAIGGDHLEDGVEAIQEGLKNPVLQPHFAIIEAKRIGRRFFKRKANPSAAKRLVSGDTVLTEAEKRRMEEILDDRGPVGEAAKEAGR